MAFFVNRLPGTELSPDERAPVRDRFVDAFLPGGARHLPYWFSFPLRPVSRDVFHGSRFRAAPELYFMVSRAASVHRASGAEIADFFANQRPHEEFDIYVFDDSWRWCIVSTDRLVDEPRHDADFLVIAAGDTGPITGPITGPADAG